MWILNEFLYRNMLKEISSVVPATTTASTTSMLTGLTPVEHGWLAWDLYFKKEDKIVTMFTNKIKDTLAFMSYAEIIFVSAKTGQRLNKIYELVGHIVDAQTMRVK